MKLHRTFIVTLALSILFMCFYALFVEPNWLEITHSQFEADVSHPIKIAHLTDLHLKKIGSLERKVLVALNTEAPDVIVITGDTVDDSTKLELAAEFFRQIDRPRLGLWAINGNWENWVQANRPEIFSKFGVQLLINSSAQIDPEITIKGFDDVTGKPGRSLSALKPKTDRFCIALFHSPEMFDDFHSGCRLSLSGHTHGGQIRLPLIGPLWLPEGSGKYISGWYGAETTKMFISRGIGTSILPIRFLSRPELAFITVRKTK